MLAMEKPRNSRPGEVFSSCIQEPSLEKGPGSVYFVPTAGMLRGLVSCQTARPTMKIRTTEIRILALGPMALVTEVGGVGFHGYVTLPVFTKLRPKGIRWGGKGTVRGSLRVPRLCSRVEWKTPGGSRKNSWKRKIHASPGDNPEIFSRDDTYLSGNLSSHVPNSF